jgi:hypothetical protein
VPLGAGRRVGACARPSRPPCLWGRVGALGPVPARSDTPRRSGRAWALDRPLLPRIAGRADGLPAGAAPPPSAAAGRGPVLPTRCLSQGAGLQTEGLSPALPPAYRPALPPFQGGGASFCQQWHLSLQKRLWTACLPMGHPDGGSGHLPPASGPRVRGHAAGKYVVASLPLLGQAGRHFLPWTHGRVGTAWGERRLEGQGCPGIHQEPARLDMAQ